MIKKVIFLGLVIVSGPVLGESFPSDSIYNLSGKWMSTGDQQGLKSLQGVPVVMSMVYTRCKASCPVTIGKMKGLENLVGQGDYVFVMASFDPTHDKIEVLKKYIADRKLDPKKWQMLSPASDSDVRELAAVTGTVYSRDEQGEYSHSNVIVLLDRKGVIRAKLDSLAADQTDFIKKLKELKRGK